MKRRVLVAMLAAYSLPTSAVASSTTNYTYDALGRLVTASTTGTVNNGVSATTTYDPADNRATHVVTGAASKVVVVPLNGLTVIPIED